ncbi:hypothetical protein F4779DRAFT_245294 [Xylariaceae sp. FL0662B]|nr:hypothetical protein F4779DRAFT_245294 [Xylariaceae sp. FL0662B]
MVELGIDALLQKGYWPNSRARNSDSRCYDSSIPSSQSSYVDVAAMGDLPVKRYYPPPPSVEDEVESLAKEYGSEVSLVPGEEPTHRGDPDQNPILLPVHEYNPERRYVLVSNPSDSSNESSDTAKKPLKRSKSRGRKIEVEPTSYEANTGRKYDHLETPGKEETEKKRDRSVHEKRRSRLETLPTINTSIDSEPRSRDGRRGKSTTRTDKSGDDYFSPRHSSRFYTENTLSPDVIEHSTRGRDRAYYNGGSSPNTQGRQRPTYRDAQYDRNPPDSRRHRERTPTSTHSTSPTYSKRHSTANLPQQVKWASKDVYEKPRQSIEVLSPRAGRGYSYSRSERDAASQIPSNSTEKRNTPPYSDCFYSSDEEVAHRMDSRRRRTSTLPDERRTTYLTTPTASKPSDGRRSKGPSPLPSPRISQNQLGERPSTSSSTIRSTTSPKDVRNPRNQDRPEPLITRASTNRPALNVSAPVSIPAIVGGAAAAAAINSSSPIDPRRSAVSIKSDSRSSASTPSSSPQRQSLRAPIIVDPPKESAALSQPMASYRRYLEEIEAGEVPDMPRCPRTRPVPGYMDWLTLPRCDSFNICPSCYEAAFSRTEFAHHFVPAPFRPSDRPVACDFGVSQYYHIAWLFTRRRRLPDLALFHALAAVAARNLPCSGPREATRLWYSVRHPRARGRPVRGFRICHACVRTVEALLPNLTGAFVAADGDGDGGGRKDEAQPARAVCAMHQYHADGGQQPQPRRRFALYFDVMEAASAAALATRTAPDVQGLADCIREYARVPECARGRPVRHALWYTMRDVPGLTVCEECFLDVVRPHIAIATTDDGQGDQGAGSVVAANFFQRPAELALAQCHLYSRRMRDVFAVAVAHADLGFLERHFEERWARELEFRDKVAGLDREVLGAAWVEAEVERLRREWKRWE